jgi:secondary thiamine-phosphate synthase enzyme
MNIFNESIAIKTNKRFEIVDITDKINHIISKHGIELGIANIFSKHSTSAIIINENESGILKDIENLGYVKNHMGIKIFSLIFSYFFF